MVQVVTEKQARAFVVLNPVAGRTSAEELRGILIETFEQHGWECTILETTADCDLTSQLRQAIADGCEMIVAAGGDGTVSMVAATLVDTEVPLGILPAGSTNVMAIELGIPADLRQAAQLLINDHRKTKIDAMEINGKHYVVSVGIGFYAVVVGETPREAKRRLGRLAYTGTMLGRLFNAPSYRFTIVIDGTRRVIRAWQVLIANAGTVGAPPFRWGPNISPNDAELDVCVFKVRNTVDYLRLLWQIVLRTRKRGANIRYFRAREQVNISADQPVSVQADGEIIGTTPVRIKVVPQAVTVVVPHTSPVLVTEPE